MVPTPLSELYLLSNVDLDPDYNYTIDFDDAEDQQAYFQDKISNTLTETNDYSFIRLEEALKVCESIEDLDGVNYLMFKNDTRWHYCFIVKKEYVNPNVTKLTLKYDVYQTFMFDFEIDESFVDREHQDRYDENGRPIFNLEEESLEIGQDYDVVSTQVVKDNIPTSESYSKSFYLIRASEPLGPLVSTWNADTGEPSTYSADTNGPTSQAGHDTNGIIDRLSSGVYCYLIPTKLNTLWFGNTNRFSHHVTLWGLPDTLVEDPRVLSCTMVKYLPKALASITFDSSYYGFYYNGSSADRTFNASPCKYDQAPTYHLLRIVSIHDKDWSEFEMSVTDPVKPTSYSLAVDLTKETKILTYPFSFYRFNTGNEYNNFKRENFDTNNFYFGMRYSAGLQGGQIIFPKHYNGKDDDIFDAINPKNTNDVTLRTDKWLEYELNNKASMNGSLILGGAQTLGSLVLGALTGGIGLAFAGGQGLGFGGQIASEMIKRHDIKNTPDSVRPSVNDTTLSHSVTSSYIIIEKVSIKSVYKAKIAKYFNHYGYKCNDFKKPNTRSRYYFNYIKTIGANLKTEIDAEYEIKLKEIFDKGITIWHYRDENTFKGVNNYDYENVEMTSLS